MENAWNDTDHCPRIAADWRAPELGLFKGVGLLSGGGLGIILIIVIILVLMGRV
jgi:Protein of unknown function (DUF3309)